MTTAKLVVGFQTCYKDVAKWYQDTSGVAPTYPASYYNAGQGVAIAYHFRKNFPDLELVYTPGDDRNIYHEGLFYVSVIDPPSFLSVLNMQEMLYKCRHAREAFEYVDSEEDNDIEICAVLVGVTPSQELNLWAARW